MIIFPYLIYLPYRCHIVVILNHMKQYFSAYMYIVHLRDVTGIVNILTCEVYVCDGENQCFICFVTTFVIFCIDNRQLNPFKY